MCGRIVQKSPLQHVIDLFSAVPGDSGFTAQARYNVAPTQNVPVVRMAADGQLQIAALRWGLIPPWAEDPSIGGRMINARAETAAQKPSFKKPLLSRRCIVPADGFYEWKAVGKQKQPYFIHVKGADLMGLAGLWERWTRGDQCIDSFTILTTQANELMSPIHQRMPVILEPMDYHAWLDPGTPLEQVLAMLHPFPAELMSAHMVSPRVNSSKFDEPSLIEPVKID